MKLRVAETEDSTGVIKVRGGPSTGAFQEVRRVAPNYIFYNGNRGAECHAHSALRPAPQPC
jgi:hypothetical protein